MGAVKRNQPQRAGSSESMYAVMEFLAEFPDDAACLDYLWRTLYSEDGLHYDCPTCKVERTFHRVASRPLYSCAKCGKAIHPTAGTIFEKSSTSLHLWFYGIYLMSSTRCGVSAKQLERELGVTYKTAWRMFNRIRSVLGQDDDPMLEGTVEMDETYIGGKAKWRSQARSRAKGIRPGRPTPEQMTPVLGMVQRGDGDSKGKIIAKVVPNTGRALSAEARARVLPGSTVYTDEWRAYQPLQGDGYHHSRVSHSQKVYVDGDVHTNTVEGFWSLLKRGIGGVYHSVSTEHLQSYLDEYTFRYNNRDAQGRGMFTAFLNRVELDARTRRVASEQPSEAQS
jgi:transposase